MRPLLLVAAPELAGGRVAAPGWVVLLAGGLVVAFAVTFLVLRFRRAAKDKR